MVDSLSKAANHPLGHHYPLGFSHLRQSLGSHSLAILDLSAFFPNGFPNLEDSLTQHGDQQLEAPQDSLKANNYDLTVSDSIQREFSPKNPSQSLGLNSNQVIRDEESLNPVQLSGTTIQSNLLNDQDIVSSFKRLPHLNEIPIIINSNGQDKVSLEDPNSFLSQDSTSKLESLKTQSIDTIPASDLGQNFSSYISFKGNTDSILPEVSNNFTASIQTSRVDDLSGFSSLSTQENQPILPGSEPHLDYESILHQENLLSRSSDSDKIADHPSQLIIDINQYNTQGLLSKKESTDSIRDVNQLALNSIFLRSKGAINELNFNHQYLESRSGIDLDSKVIYPISCLPTSELTQLESEAQPLDLLTQKSIPLTNQLAPKTNSKVIENLQRTTHTNLSESVNSSLVNFLRSSEGNANNLFLSEIISNKSNLISIPKNLEDVRLDPSRNKISIANEVPSLIEKYLSNNSVQLKDHFPFNTSINHLVARKDASESRQAVQEMGYSYPLKSSFVDPIVSLSITNNQPSDHIVRRTIGRDRPLFSPDSTYQISNSLQPQINLEHLDIPSINLIPNRSSSEPIQRVSFFSNLSIPEKDDFSQSSQASICQAENTNFSNTIFSTISDLSDNPKASSLVNLNIVNPHSSKTQTNQEVSFRLPQLDDKDNKVQSGFHLASLDESKFSKLHSIQRKEQEDIKLSAFPSPRQTDENGIRSSDFSIGDNIENNKIGLPTLQLNNIHANCREFEYPDVYFLKEDRKNELEKQRIARSALKDEDLDDAHSPTKDYFWLTSPIQTDNSFNLSQKPLSISTEKVGFGNTFIDQTHLARTPETSFIFNQTNTTFKENSALDDQFFTSSGFNLIKPKLGSQHHVLHPSISPLGLLLSPENTSTEYLTEFNFQKSTSNLFLDGFQAKKLDDVLSRDQIRVSLDTDPIQLDISDRASDHSQQNSPIERRISPPLLNGIIDNDLDISSYLQQEVVPLKPQDPIPLESGYKVIDPVRDNLTSSIKNYQDKAINASQLLGSVTHHINPDKSQDPLQVKIESETLTNNISSTQLPSSLKDTTDIDAEPSTISNIEELLNNTNKNNDVAKIKPLQSIVEVDIDQLAERKIETFFVEPDRIQPSFEFQSDATELTPDPNYDNNSDFQPPLLEDQNTYKVQLFSQTSDSSSLVDNTSYSLEKGGHNELELPLLIDTSSSPNLYQSSLDLSNNKPDFSDPQYLDSSYLLKKEDLGTLEINNKSIQKHEDIKYDEIKLDDQNLLISSSEKNSLSSIFLLQEESNPTRDSINYSHDKINISCPGLSDLSDINRSDKLDLIIENTVESSANSGNSNTLNSSCENTLDISEESDLSDISNQSIQLSPLYKSDESSISKLDLLIDQTSDKNISLDEHKTSYSESLISTGMDGKDKRINSSLPIIFDSGLPEVSGISKVEDHDPIQKTDDANQMGIIKSPQILDKDNLASSQFIQSRSILKNDELYQDKLIPFGQPLNVNQTPESENLSNVHLVRSDQVNYAYGIDESLESPSSLDTNFSTLGILNLINPTPENNHQLQRHIDGIYFSQINLSDYSSDDIRSGINLKSDDSWALEAIPYRGDRQNDLNLNQSLFSPAVPSNATPAISSDIISTSLIQENREEILPDFANIQPNLVLNNSPWGLALSSTIDQDVYNPSSILPEIVQKKEDRDLWTALVETSDHESPTDSFNLLGSIIDSDISKFHEAQPLNLRPDNIIQKFDEDKIDIFSKSVNHLTYLDIDSSSLDVSTGMNVDAQHLIRNQNSLDNSNYWLEPDQLDHREVRCKTEFELSSDTDQISPVWLSASLSQSSKSSYQSLYSLSSESEASLENWTQPQMHPIYQGDNNLPQLLLPELPNSTVNDKSESFLSLPISSLNLSSDWLEIEASSQSNSIPRSEKIMEMMDEPSLSYFSQENPDFDYSSDSIRSVELTDRQDLAKDSESILPITQPNFQPLKEAQDLINQRVDEFLFTDENGGAVIQQKKDMKLDASSSKFSLASNQENYVLPESDSSLLKSSGEDYSHSSTLGVLQPIMILQPIMANPIQSKVDELIPEEVDQQADPQSLYWTSDSSGATNNAPEYEPTLLLPTQWTTLADLVTLPKEIPSKISLESYSQSTLSLQATAEISPLPATPLVEPTQVLHSCQTNSSLATPPRSKLRVSRRSLSPRIRDHAYPQTKLNPLVPSPLFPGELIQADEDAPFTTITAESDETIDPQSIERLAQEIYYLLRQRLGVEQERHGQVYPKRFL